MKFLNAILLFSIVLSANSPNLCAQLISYDSSSTRKIYQNENDPVVVTTKRALKEVTAVAKQASFSLYYGSADKEDFEKGLIYLWQELSRSMTDTLDDVPETLVGDLNNMTAERYRFWAYTHMLDKTKAILAKELAKEKKCAAEIVGLYDSLIARFDAVEAYLNVKGVINEEAAGKYYQSILKASVQVGLEIAFQRLSQRGGGSREEMIISIALTGIEAAIEIGGTAYDHYSKANTAHQAILKARSESDNAAKQLINRLIEDRKWNFSVIPLESLEKEHAGKWCERQPDNIFFYSFSLPSNFFMKGKREEIDIERTFEVLRHTPEGPIFGLLRAKLATALISSEVDAEVAHLYSENANLPSFQNAPTPNSVELVRKCAGIIDAVSVGDPADCKHLYIQLARALSLNGNFQEATSIREEILDARWPLLPTNFEYVHSRVSSMAGQYDIALKSLKECLRSDLSYLAICRVDPDLGQLRKNRANGFANLTVPRLGARIKEGYFWDQVVIDNKSVFRLTEIVITLTNGQNTIEVPAKDLYAGGSKTLDLSSTLDGNVEDWTITFDCAELPVNK